MPDLRADEMTNEKRSLSILRLVAYFIAFSLASSVSVLLLPGALTGVTLDSLDKAHLLAIALLCASYGAALFLLFVLRFFNKPSRAPYKLLFIIVLFSISIFSLYLYENQKIELLVISTLLVTAVCLWLFQKSRLFPISILSVLGLVAITSVWLTDFETLSQRMSGTLSTHKNIQTAFYNLQVDTYPGRIPRSIKGGGLTQFGDGYLLATGDGRLYFLMYDVESKRLEFRRLAFTVPINRAKFRADTSKKVDTNKFRVTDVYAQRLRSGYRVFVAHHFWKHDQQCFVLRLSAIGGSVANLTSDSAKPNWNTVYESSPCLPLKETGHAFAGHQAGGRIDMLDDKTVILTVGDHTFDGNGSELILPQDDTSSYGKSILIDVESGSSKIFSKGHRNPQGLHVDKNRSIWLTEHGPQGGDELNLIVPGANYGWPLETYGTAYGKTEWPLSIDQGRHRTFRAPAFAWVPSIGISNLISVGPSYFSMWETDLIVSSMARNSLFRIRIENDLVRYAEEIEVGQRIRDLIEGHDGQLLLWTDKASIMIISKADKIDNSQKSFAACAGCHVIADGRTHVIGPDLFGISGRRPGTARDFEYSEAMKGLRGKWNRESLDQFLTNPDLFAPGTSMIYPGISDSARREELVDYLLNDGG